VLMVDVGGTNVKVMACYEGEMRRMPSGEKLTPSEMVRGVLELASDLEFDRVSLGFPGLVEHGKPVRIINDAAMQALGNYSTGRLLFLGLGTSMGTAVIVDDIVIPIEVGLTKLTRKERLMDPLSKVALKRDGQEHWTEAVVEAVELLQNVFKPDETVLGSGNARLVDPLPANCRCVDNRSAYVGAQRLWEGSYLFARACPTSWRIHRNEAHI